MCGHLHRRRLSDEWKTGRWLAATSERSGTAHIVFIENSWLSRKMPLSLKTGTAQWSSERKRSKVMNWTLSEAESQDTGGGFTKLLSRAEVRWPSCGNEGKTRKEFIFFSHAMLLIRMKLWLDFGLKDIFHPLKVFTLFSRTVIVSGFEFRVLFIAGVQMGRCSVQTGPHYRP